MYRLHLMKIQRVSILILFILMVGCDQTIKPSSEVKTIADDLYNLILEESIYLRLQNELSITFFPDMTYENSLADVEEAKTMIARIDAVDQNVINHSDNLTLAMMRQFLQSVVDGIDYYWNEFSITPYNIYSANYMKQVFSTFKFENQDDMDLYLKLVSEYKDFFNQQLDKLKIQDEKGIQLPKPELPLVRDVISQYQLSAKAMLTPNRDRLSKLSEEKINDFFIRLENKISNEVLMAFDSILAFLEGDYSNRASERVGAYQYPGGKDYYNYRIKAITSLDLTAEGIHEIGMRNVEALYEKMAALRGKLGFEKGQKSFHEKIMNDPHFIAKTPEEVEARYMSYIRKIEPHIDRLFSKQPEAPYGVTRLSQALEGSMTFGYYARPTPDNPVGEYNYNGSNLNNRPMLWAGPLIYHELVPGHHFQINLSMENEDMPEIRKDLILAGAANVEGWGNYGAKLAEEIGMLDDPLDQYGWAVFHIFFSTRLVVDTGMNALGWSLEEARDFMRKYTFATETEIATETLRYAVDMPGQALAYKIGMDKFFELRSHMQNELGDNYNIRDFHDAVLKEGPMPLNILEKHIDWTIDRIKKK